MRSLFWRFVIFVSMLILLILFLFDNGNGIEESKIVNTKYGPIAGLAQKSPNFTVYEFLGIPYAKPPIGKLRFEKPEFPEPWKETLNASKYAFSCLQCQQKNIHLRRRYQGGYSEDCLFLNIWSPLQKNKLHPVLFYIHGGSYYAGSSEAFSPLAARIYSSQGIVVVSINYRLGHWGFLTLNDTQIEPNLGLWDQNLALKWVNENIESFGGNKGQITLWGDSAGASSVSQHSFSKYSRDLFHHGIQMSGSAFAAFARGTNTIESSRKIIQRLGCSNRSDLKKCLQSKSIDEFYHINGTETKVCWEDHLAYPSFSPIYDGKFIEGENLPATAIKPTIVGFTQKEGRSFVLQNSWPPFYKDITKIKDSFNNDSLYEFIETWVTNTGFKATERKNATDDIFNFYSSKAKGAGDHFYFIEQLVRIFSDFMFNIPGIREAFTKQQVGYPIYAFLFDYDGREWPKEYPVQGSTHSDQYPYTMTDPGKNYSVNDLTVKWLIQEAFVQFVKTGNPTTEMMEWLEFDEYFSYLSLKPDPEMGAELFLDSYRFWTNRMLKYSFDFISQEKWLYQDSCGNLHEERPVGSTCNKEKH